MAARAPQVTEQLVRNVPRLDGVADILAAQGRGAGARRLSPPTCTPRRSRWRRSSCARRSTSTRSSHKVARRR